MDRTRTAHSSKLDPVESDTLETPTDSPFALGGNEEAPRIAPVAFATADALDEAAILALPRGAGLALRDAGALGGLALEGRAAPALRWMV